MTALDVFRNDEWSVRTVVLDDEPWFVAADVCAALGHTNGRKAVSDHVDELDRGVTVGDTPGGRQNLTIINESGLYALIFGSRLATAQQFKRWVTSEVLPAIRRTGTYVQPQAMPSHPEALRGWADALDQLAVSQARVAELAPAAAFAEQLAAAEGDYSVREASQILCRDHSITTGERRLFATLKEFGWLDRTGQPYQAQVDNGRLARRITTYTDPNTGDDMARTQVRVTPKGVRELHRRLGGTDALVFMVQAGAA